MAEVIGYLREDRATHGEETTLEQLRTELPDTYTVYVECPLRWKDIERNPDFVVVAPYGVIVLEVKDWVQLGERVDQFDVEVWERGGRVRHEKNPVAGARDCATLLASKLQEVPELLNAGGKPDVAWGYGVVFPNLPYTVISKLRQVWGEPYVFGAETSIDVGQSRNCWPPCRLIACTPCCPRSWLLCAWSSILLCSSPLCRARSRASSSTRGNRRSSASDQAKRRRMASRPPAG